MESIKEQLEVHLREQGARRRFVPSMLTTSIGTFHGFYVTAIDDHFVYGMDQQQRVDFALDLNRDTRTIWRIPLTSVWGLFVPRYDWE
jgi:hypothetical protein